MVRSVLGVVAGAIVWMVRFYALAIVLAKLWRDYAIHERQWIREGVFTFLIQIKTSSTIGPQSSRSTSNEPSRGLWPESISNVFKRVAPMGADHVRPRSIRDSADTPRFFGTGNRSRSGARDT